MSEEIFLKVKSKEKLGKYSLTFETVEKHADGSVENTKNISIDFIIGDNISRTARALRELADIIDTL